MDPVDEFIDEAVTQMIVWWKNDGRTPCFALSAMNFDIRRLKEPPEWHDVHEAARNAFVENSIFVAREDGDD